MRSVLYFLIIFLYSCAGTQKTKVVEKNDHAISVNEVERIERILASDDMQGRGTGTPGIEKAAAFISDEFKNAGLQPVQGNSFLQEFVMVRPRLISISGTTDGRELDPKNVIIVSSKPSLAINDKSGYRIEQIKDGNLFDKAQLFLHSNQNIVAVVDTGMARNFARLSFFKRQLFKTNHDVVFILGSTPPKEFTINQQQSLDEIKLSNVVGLLPGKSRKNEYVIFSAHYDHLGIGKPQNGDSTYNGANDDAAGTTAVILLANYFKKRGNQERTLVFAAFTAEEMGGFGSQYFSQQFNPAQVMAMFNIEMIGTESKWGRGSAYITGFEKTDMGKILQQNLQGTSFTFHPDPYPEQQLFYRSDNATLARLGVPAHTISTSKMDSEKYYHTPDDEVETLDLQNMAQIIQAIAVSSTSIISGKDTPGRLAIESSR